MKLIKSLVLPFILIITLSNGALSADFTKGTVKKIDSKGKRITIIHEELQNLDMPAMTMVFFLAEDTMLDRVSEGDAIEFVADRINGKLTVVELKGE